MKFIKTFSLFAIFSLGTTQNWSINIKAEINLWNSNNTATDYENYFGVNENALDSYDVLDVPEPPTLPNNYISLYFYQPEGNENFTYYTQDIKERNQDLLNSTGKRWDAYVVSDAFGETTIEMIIDESFPNCYYKMKVNEQDFFQINQITIDLDPFLPQLIEITIYDCQSLKLENIEIPQKLNLDVYPNPLNGNGIISYILKSNENIEINIYNILGNKKIINLNELNANAGINYQNIDFKNLESGIYFLELKTQKVVETKKITILK
tara:strand:+ start:1455 stop:2252 length:798 start_codon:yes stop_codon:yes gene_type:complete